MAKSTAQSGASSPWYEDERFWVAIDYLLCDPKRPVAEETAKFIKLLQVAPPANVLDLCCGPGRYSVELAKLGFRVTGVDRTQRYLQKARKLALEQQVDVDFVESDMREFRREAAFDATVNFFTSFGYFEDPAEDLLVLRNVFASLRPGGMLLMEMAGREVLAPKYTPRDWMEYPDGSLFLFDREVLPGWSEIRNRWLFLKDGTKTEFNFTHRLYSADSLTRVMTDAGFSIVRVYGSLDGTPYDRSATRLVVTGRKPE